MRVLWLTDMATPEPRSGGGIRSMRLVQAAAREWPVDVVSITDGLDVDRYVAASGARSAVESPPDRRSRAGSLRMAVQRMLAVPAVLKHSESAAARAESAAAAGDVVVVEHGWLLGHVPPAGRVVVVLHNVDSELVAQLPAVGARNRVERRWNVLAYRTQERRLGRRPQTWVTVVSERDAELLGYRAVVLPNGADLPAAASPLPPAGLLFVGSMGYPPNAEAVRWWAREVWPGSGLPPLTVVGQAGAGELRDLHGDPSVDIVGEVVDIAPWLERARVVAVPLRSGAGTRLKVVEALAHGRVVVSTRKGAEGTGAVDGEHLVLADDPASFAAAVRRVLVDHEHAESLAARGRELALTMTWDSVGDRLNAVLARASRGEQSATN